MVGWLLVVAGFLAPFCGLAGARWPSAVWRRGPCWRLPAVADDRRGPAGAHRAVRGADLGSAVSTTWSLCHPKHAEGLDDIKLAAQLPLYWSAICGRAAGLPLRLAGCWPGGVLACCLGVRRSFGLGS